MLKRLFAVLLTVGLMASALASCSSKSSKNEESDMLRYRMAYRAMDDGWVYVFENTYTDDDFDYSSHSETRIPFSFRGINLRYRYSDDYVETIEVADANGETTKKEVFKSTLILGQSSAQLERSDLKKITNYLGYERDGTYFTTDELLALTASDLDFNYIDAEMFLDLMHKCLHADPIELGPYVNIPSWALFTEPEYMDDYKFQIGLIGGFGTVEVIMFDVLYKTGDGLTDYVQLYDLVRNGKATDEQVLLLSTLQEIECGIVSTDDLQYQLAEYGNDTIAGVSLLRLYTMLKNISTNDYGSYIVHTY